MAGLLDQFSGSKRALVVVAAESEMRAVMQGRASLREISGAPRGLRVASDDRLEVVQGGVGKVNAALAVAWWGDPGRHSCVLSIGIAGVLPPAGSLAIGDVVVATRCAYADEGGITPGGYVDIATMGFPLGAFDGRGAVADPALVKALAVLGTVGVVATVSTCSGTDAAAQEVARRTGAAAEGMEGAAVAHAGLRLGLAVGEVRVISNTTGDRDKQRWDLKGSLARLGEVAARL